MVSIDVVDYSNVHMLQLDKFIEKFSEKTGANTDADFLHESIINKQSLMIILAENNKYAGFFVITEEYNEFDELELLVWAAYADGHFSDQVIVAGMHEIKSIAKKMAAKRIFFRTTRKGWAKRAQAYGFSPAEQTYEIKVA